MSPTPFGLLRRRLRVDSKSGIARNSWNIADQVVSSLANLAVALFVARYTSQLDFGSFALAMTIYIFTILLSRAVCGQTLLIVIARSEARGPGARTIGGSFLGLGMLIGLAGAAASCATSLFTEGELHRDALTLGVIIVPLVVQDVSRFIFFGLGQPRRSFESDVIWFTVQLGLTVVVLNYASDPTSVALLTAWGLGGVAGAAYALVRLRLPISPGGGLRTLRRNRRVCGQFALELLALSGGTQVLFYVVAAIVGRAEVAGLRGATVIFGPVTLLFTASRSGLLAHAARTAHRARDRLIRECGRVSVVLGAVMSLLALALIFLPTDVGELLLGPTWSLTQPLLPAFAFQFTVLAFAEGAGIGLRALAASHLLSRIALRYACLSLLLGVLGAYTLGAAGAAWGNAISALLLLVEYALSLRKVLDSGRSDLPTYQANQPPGPAK